MRNNEIIRHLANFSPAEIYHVSTRQSFIRGYDYYRQERLLQLVWSKDSQVLIARIQGTKIYSISFFVEKDDLRYMCNCPVWTPSQHCKHVICAILSIKNLLNSFISAARGSPGNGYSWQDLSRLLN
jgi:non-specific serine/threonine protein kinase